MGKDLRVRSTELKRRSARLRADLTALHLECARIVARVDATRLASLTDGDALPTPPTDPHDVAMQTLREIRMMLDSFSIEWQIAMVKALTARTIVKAQERTRPAPGTLSA